MSNQLDYEINKELGECYLFMGDFDKAEEYYRKAAGSNSQSAAPFLGLATVAVQRSDLDKALVLLGILDRRGGLVAGVPRHIVARPCCRLAYIRGALIAGGFVADPRGDFHLEIAVQGEQYAKGLCDLLEQIGVHARVNARRGSYAVYIKSAEEIEHLLKLIGAKRSVAEIEEARAVKLVKNDVNRRVNAELANQTRSAGAAQHQLALIDELEQRGLRDALPDALAVFCDLRERYPDLSLRDLGEMADPPLSKSALYHRVLRLEKLIEANR